MNTTGCGGCCGGGVVTKCGPHHCGKTYCMCGSSCNYGSNCTCVGSCNCMASMKSGCCGGGTCGPNGYCGSKCGYAGGCRGGGGSGGRGCKKGHTCTMIKCPFVMSIATHVILGMSCFAIGWVASMKVNRR